MLGARLPGSEKALLILVEGLVQDLAVSEGRLADTLIHHPLLWVARMCLIMRE